jgi:hypothetical protein
MKTNIYSHDGIHNLCLPKLTKAPACTTSHIHSCAVYPIHLSSTRELNGGFNFIFTFPHHVIFVTHAITLFIFGLHSVEFNYINLQLLCFWILSIFLFLFKTYNVSETGFCLHLQVEPTQLGPTDRASPYLGTAAPTQDGI